MEKNPKCHSRCRQHLNQELEGNSEGFEFNEWRKGRQSPYPLVWNEDKFREYERMIHEAGQLDRLGQVALERIE